MAMNTCPACLIGVSWEHGKKLQEEQNLLVVEMLQQLVKDLQGQQLCLFLPYNRARSVRWNAYKCAHACV